MAVLRHVLTVVYRRLSVGFSWSLLGYSCLFLLSLLLPFIFSFLHEIDKLRVQNIEYRRIKVD